MKSFVKFLIRLIAHQKSPASYIDDIRWEQLDGAEFSVVYPKQPSVALDK